MKINFNYTKNIIILFFITFSMLITNYFIKSIASKIYILSIIGLYIFLKKYKDLDKKFYKCIICIIAFFLLIFLISDYGISDAVKKFVFLLLVYLDIMAFNPNDNLSLKEKKKISYFYNFFINTVSIWLLIFIIFNLFNGSFGKAFFFPGSSDKNFTAVAIFLFFCFCQKKENIIGTIISIIFGILLGSRLFILTIIVYYLIKLILKIYSKSNISKKIGDYIINFKTKEIFITFIIANLIMVLISYFMVFCIPLTSIKNNRNSLNDGSNAIRVRANVFAIETFTKHPHFILYGYDNNIKKVLGIEEIKGSPLYRNFRLVQPHNLILNLVMKYGVVLSILYLFILCKILSKLWNKDNMPILFSYIFMNMFMHSLLSGSYLIFFIYLLNVQNKKKKNNCLEKDLYICSSLYHLLIVIIKSFKSKRKIDLILAANSRDQSLTKNKKIIKNLKASKLFNNIVIFDYANQQRNILKSKFKSLKNYLYTFKVNLDLDFDFEQYQNIYMFNDTILIGRILNLQKIYYHVIEDGTDCYIFNKNRIVTKGFKAYLKKYIFQIKDMGQSKYVLDIEVNNKKDIFIKNKNIIEVSREELFSELTKKEQNIIKNIFIEDVNLKQLNGKTMIITQPFVASEILPNEKMQIKLYKKIIKEYCNNEFVIIKNHPRDKINYQKEIKNCMLLNEVFPLEILNFFPSLKLKKVITVSSTSINIFNCCEEKLILGWNYIDEFKEGASNEK